MRKRKKLLAVVSALCLLVTGSVFTGCGSGGSAAGSSKTLNVAVDVEAPSLDTHINAATASRHVANCVFEGIFECDETFTPKMQLLSAYNTSDNKLWEFTLREGVKFHNGKELKAEDAVASLNRWLKNNKAVAAKLTTAGEKFEKTGDYTFKIELAEANSSLPQMLASPTQFPIITTKELCEKYPDSYLQEYVGTGACKFESYVPNSYYHLVKNEDYKGPGYTQSSWAGDKEFNFEDVYFYTVPDITTRVSGLQSGQYDIIENVSGEYRSVVDSYSGTSVKGFKRAIAALDFNVLDGGDSPLLNTKVRQAIKMVANVSDMGAANSSDSSFYTIDGSLMASVTSFYTETKNNYADTAAAKKLVEESGYDGKEIVLATTQAYPAYYDITLVLQKQLESIGLKTRVDVYDWASLLSLVQSGDPKADWDIYYMIWPNVPTPLTLNPISNLHITGTPGTEMTEHMKNISSASDDAAAKAAWAECAKWVDDNALAYKLWDVNTFLGYSDKLTGFQVTNEYSIFGCSKN